MPIIVAKKVESEKEKRFVADQTFYAFSPSPGSQENQLKRREYFVSAREFIVLEDGKPMSTSNYVPMTQNIRGKILQMGGVAGVASYPEARRKGYVKLLMKEMFDEMRSEKRSVSILYPFRESFYTKFGYFTSEQEMIGSLLPSDLRQIAKLDLGIQMERVSFIEGIDQLYDFHLEAQKKWHAFSLYDKLWMKSGETNPSWVVFAWEGKKIVGALVYRISGFAGTLKIVDMIFLTSKAKYGLLQWVASHIDHVTKVEINLNPNYKLETWIDDLKLNKITREWVPSHMFRVISVDELSGLAVGNGEVNIKITDPNCPWNDGTWNFRSDLEKLLVTKTTNTPDATLSIAGFSAVIYGVYDLDDFEIKGWGDVKEKAKSSIVSLFPYQTPFVSKFV